MDYTPLDLLRFQRRFRNDKACHEYLRRQRWPEVFICPKCKWQHAWWSKAKGVYECTHCHHQASLEYASKDLPWVHILISNAKRFILGTHHGVSPKHLHRYLSEYCYRFNRRYWEPQLFDRILTACANTRTITYQELSG